MQSAAQAKAKVEVPAGQERIFGRILDCDAHLYMHPDVMGDIVGDIGGGFSHEYIRKQFGTEQYYKDLARNRDEFWSVKGLAALGSCEADERVEVMDAMGMRAQLLFPNTAVRELRINSDAARAACSRYNDYAIAWSKKTGDRARVACQINLGDRDWALKELDRVLKLGACGVTLPCSQAPAGVSPAHEMWDPFWARLEEANVPALMHLAAGGLVTSTPDDPMIPPREFGDAKALRASFDFRPGAEETIGSYFFLVAHIPVEVFVMTMIMGGVFERFPRLAFGAIECGAGWVGPMARRMEAHATMLSKIGVKLPLCPTEYLRRNVRVTPFWHEDIRELVDVYKIPEVYVFSTDFPHVEGTRDPIGRFRKTMTTLDPSYEDDFFFRNASLLFPDLTRSSLN
jgi:predicted TIM-barrel fold metal-dependent hydrolase